MLAFMVTSLLFAGQAAEKAKVPDDLKKAATAVTDAKGYAFEIVSESTGGVSRGGRPGGRRGEGGGGEGGGGAPTGGPPKEGGTPPPGGAVAAGGPPGGRGGFDGPQTFAGKFEKGKPIAFTRDDQTVYRLDQQVVVSREGLWELLPQFGGGGSRRGPGGAPGAGGGAGGGDAPPAGGPPAGTPPGGAGGAPGGGRGARGGGDMRRFGWEMMVSSLTLPHELLASIDSSVSDVKREEKDGKVVFSGPLTAEFAGKISGATRMKEMMARGGGGNAPDLVASGTLTITTGKDGAIETLRIETKISGGPGGEQTRKVDVKLSGVGSTTVDVPKEALAKFSA